jgi:hypothetical protein
MCVFIFWILFKSEDQRICSILEIKAKLRIVVPDVPFLFRAIDY